MVLNFGNLTAKTADGGIRVQKFKVSPAVAYVGNQNQDSLEKLKSVSAP